MPVPDTRRGFLKTGAAVTLLPYAHAAAADAARARPNIVLVIIDTLRADHVSAYGGRAHTPSIDSLAARGVRYTRFYPEAMATVPARRSILTGRRVWPFRGWHRYPTLRNTPGWQPTDDPFLGYSPYYEGFRDSFNHFWRIGGLLGRSAPVKTV